MMFAKIVDPNDVIVGEVGGDEIARRFEVEDFGQIVTGDVEVQQKGHVGERRQVGDVVVGKMDHLEGKRKLMRKGKRRGKRKRQKMRRSL